MAKRGEREYDVEFRVVWPSGAIHYIKAYAQIVRDAQGNPLRMTGVNFDITGRRLGEGGSCAGTRINWRKSLSAARRNWS